MLDINKRHGFYDVYNPYDEFMIEVLKAHGITKFTRRRQAWMLGGPECIEFANFLEAGISSTPGGYHNVDWGKGEERLVHPGSSIQLSWVKKGLPQPRTVGFDPKSLVTHPETNFFDIDKIWKDQDSHPAVLSYDSTAGITKYFSVRFVDMIRLVRLALERSNSLLVMLNLMTDRAGWRTKWSKGPWDIPLAKGLVNLDREVGALGYKIDWWPQAVLGPKKGSYTNMVAVAGMIKKVRKPNRS